MTWGARWTGVRGGAARSAPPSAGTPTTAWSRSTSRRQAASKSRTAPTACWSTPPPGSAGRPRRSASGATSSPQEPPTRVLAVSVGGASRVSYGPEPQKFRQVLGHFCTGVTVITAVDDGEPVGFSCQAFAALSLDPPLVVFCPARTSNTWSRIASAELFAVNVLAAGQRETPRKFGRTG